MPEYALEFNSVCKTYGDTKALDSVNLNIKPNEKVALLGCNGAGKSTFLNIATGLGLPSKGEVKILNQNPLSLKSRFQVSFLPQVLKFPSFLKVKDVIKVVEGHFNDNLLRTTLDRLRLTPFLNHYCHSLSGGEERKLSFALSLLGRRRFLILDEPTANIDILSKREVHELLKDHLKKEQGALLFSSHEMHEVEHLADRVVVLNQGRIIADGSVHQIKKSFSSTKVTFECAQEDLQFSTALKLERENKTYTLYGESGDDIVKELIQVTKSFYNLRVEPISLEEVFVKIWGQQ
ncbi:MAG: ABC transporter ATP-binding protein [Bdellovibrionales bacterium]|nr:ABC transporter ATP-binding protein [Bdellovibrionales bacterium]